ncbi:cupin domain-containing protein [Gluconacetobacter sacchari]|uniref:Cupin domain-containing protein n=2 Tax=Gluconacetobacter sacchari TaxID=92759 RepID=A0A7W4IFN8_9PROT|nr:cupin domain-containing protein [Gluconacetobacter sacchari]MBB2161965.1 cupin domain-containing protein [Gluconacetobacter sacchari]
MVVRSARQIDVRRISPTDTNYFAILFDPERDGVDLVSVVEIFAVGGRTPPNTHARAHEFFYVLSGEGIAYCDGQARKIARGDALMLRPGATHQVVNTGARKLYTLTFMVPNEDFAELIRAGDPLSLDDEDLRTLTGSC